MESPSVHGGEDVNRLSNITPEMGNPEMSNFVFVINTNTATPFIKTMVISTQYQPRPPFSFTTNLSAGNSGVSKEEKR
jgi:hypothetical protein